MLRTTALTIAGLLLSLPANAEPTSQDGAADLSRSATDTHHVVNAEGGKPIGPASTSGLARVGGTTAATAKGGAGTEQEKVVTQSGPKAVRPLATQRTLRRMNVERFSVEKEMRACANEHGASAATALVLRLSVAPGGNIEETNFASPHAMPAPLLACVVAAMSTARFGAPGGLGATVALRVTVPAADQPVAEKPAETGEKHASR